MTHDYSAGAWRYPTPKPVKRPSNAVTVAFAVAAFLASLMLGMWVVDGWNNYLHDSMQIELMYH